MGKKKEQLREELAITRQSVDQLESENQHLRQQLVDVQAAPPFRLITDPKPTPTRLRIASALGIDPTSYEHGQITDEMILEAVERLRNPHHGADHGDALVISKNDSLAEAIHQNRSERSTLETALSRTRFVLNRLAGALQVGQWNADGDELVEKAQRFGVFAHWLRKRLREYELAAQEPADTVGTSTSTVLSVGALANERAKEVRTILAALIGDKELARILQNKPSAKASKTVLDLAENPAPTGHLYLDVPWTDDDIEHIRASLAKLAGAHNHGARLVQLELVFTKLTTSAAAREEFLSWMNAVVLPTLRKQHPHYAAKEN